MSELKETFNTFAAHGDPTAFECFKEGYALGLRSQITPQSHPLQVIFDMQAALNLRTTGKDLTVLTAETEKTEWLLKYTRAMMHEVIELECAVSWKHWAKYQKYDEQNAREEIVDILHFLVSVAQVVGMTSDDVFNAYLAKNKVNHARQESGYTVKDHTDSLHI